MDLLEAFDLLTFCRTMAERLEGVSSAHERALKRTAEGQWLEHAKQKLLELNESTKETLFACRQLPEFSFLSDEFAFENQQVAVEALERFQAGIAFHLGTRAPLIEVLFPKSNFAKLRKSSAVEFLAAVTDFEKRLASSYCTRMLAEPAMQFAKAPLETIAAALATWKDSRASVAAENAHAPTIRKQLLKWGQQAARQLKQSRLLAEAALTSFDNVFEESGLAAKPKKRNWPVKKSEETQPEEVVAAAVEVHPEPEEPMIVEPVALVKTRARKTAS